MRLTDVLVTPSTRVQIDTFVSKPSHALLLVGAYGMGKFELAKAVSKMILDIEADDEIERYPYFKVVRDDNGTITIDMVREIKRFFSLKTAGKKQIRRILVIDDASLMNNEAQNALLKILEEPPENSLLILTAQTITDVNPTVTSRTQIIRIAKPSLKETLDYFRKFSYNETDIRQAYLFSNGAIGMTSLILSNESDSKFLTYLDDAKFILKSDRFTRLTKLDDWSKDKVSLRDKLYSLKRVCLAALTQSIETGQTRLTLRMTEAVNQILKAESALGKNANTKLLVTNLFIGM